MPSRCWRWRVPPATRSATLVHYGTDFVFDGLAETPYTEADPPRPGSVYGMSKLLGEWFAADAPAHYVLRVESLFGGPRAKSSVDRIIDGISGGQPVRVFSDRTVTPSYVDDVADATVRLLDARPDPGLYHCVNSGTTTWLGLAEEVARVLERTADLQPVSVASVPMRAKRPQYCALSNTKLTEAGIPMPPWQDAIARYIAVRRCDRDQSRQAPATSAETIRPTARHEVKPGESIPAAWISAGTSESRRIMKSANDTSGGCSLARMPEPASRRSSS